MKKRVAAVLLAIAMICATFTSCTKMGDNKEYTTICDAQKSVLSLSSAKISVSSRYENQNKSDEIKSELMFAKAGEKSNNISYMQTQFDSKGKPVYCDFSDGEKAEQWFIGKGWSTKETPLCTVSNPHKYIKLLSTSQSKETIKKIECVDKGENKMEYTMEMNPIVLNKTTYKTADFTVVSQAIKVTVNEKNELLSYDDKACLTDKATGFQTTYGLNIAISMQNSIVKIDRPELRDYSIKLPV